MVAVASGGGFSVETAEVVELPADDVFVSAPGVLGVNEVEPRLNMDRGVMCFPRLLMGCNGSPKIKDREPSTCKC